MARCLRRSHGTVWDEDFAKVCAARAPEDIAPKAFAELAPHLSEAIKRIERGQRPFLVVNSDSAEAPDFSAAPVWKIIVGGNKLSRGYTIEGLTVSYYRRVANTADTLMQMGRWFGFRPGYRDLVRVFLGVQEGKRADADLVSLFKEVCRIVRRREKAHHLSALLSRPAAMPPQPFGAEHEATHWPKPRTHPGADPGVDRPPRTKREQKPHAACFPPAPRARLEAHLQELLVSSVHITSLS